MISPFLLTDLLSFGCGRASTACGLAIELPDDFDLFRPSSASSVLRSFTFFARFMHLDLVLIAGIEDKLLPTAMLPDPSAPPPFEPPPDYVGLD